MVKLTVNGTRDGAVAVAGRRKSSQTLDQQQGADCARGTTTLLQTLVKMGGSLGSAA